MLLSLRCSGQRLDSIFEGFGSEDAARLILRFSDPLQHLLIVGLSRPKV